MSEQEKQSNRFTGCTKAFIHHNPKYFGISLTPGTGTADQIEFGLFGQELAGHHHAYMVWHKIPGQAPYARLEAMFDAWTTLAAMSDVVEALAALTTDRPSNITPDDFKAVLKQCGFMDYTDYVLTALNDLGWHVPGRMGEEEDPTDL